MWMLGWACRYVSTKKTLDVFVFVFAFVATSAGREVKNSRKYNLGGRTSVFLLYSRGMRRSLV